MQVLTGQVAYGEITAVERRGPDLVLRVERVARERRSWIRRRGELVFVAATSLESLDLRDESVHRQLESGLKILSLAHEAGLARLEAFEEDMHDMCPALFTIRCEAVRLEWRPDWRRSLMAWGTSR